MKAVKVTHPPSKFRCKLRDSKIFLQAAEVSTGWRNFPPPRKKNPTWCQNGERRPWTSLFSQHQKKKGDFVKGFSEPWSKVEGWKKGGKKSVVLWKKVGK